MAGTVVGLDMGSTLRAVELQNAAGAKPVVVREAEIAIPEGAVRRGEVVEVSTVATALKQLWSRGGLRSKRVVLGIGGPSVFAREFSVPQAPLAQIRESLPFQVQELLPVPVADAVLDFYPISHVPGDAPTVAGLLVAAIKDAVSANVAAVTQAGLRPVHLDFVPFGITRALAPVAVSRDRIAIVDIGEGTTNVIVADHGVPLFVRIIPNGGGDITRAISSRMQWDPERAEEIKRSIGMGTTMLRPEDRPVVEIVYEVVGELLGSIRNTLSYYATAKPDGPIRRILLTGGGGRLGGLVGAMAEVTGFAVEPAGIDRTGRSRSRSETSSDLTTAYGIALGTRA